MEVRLRFTIAEHGHSPENGERFMDAFMKVCPDGGPSVSQNTEDGTLTVTFAVDAADARDGVTRGGDIFVEGAMASGLDPIDILDIEASVVSDKREESRELQPA